MTKYLTLVVAILSLGGIGSRAAEPPYAVSTYVGNRTMGFADGIGNAARFNRPSGIVAADDGSLYVVDTDNFVIRKVTARGGVTTFAGSPGNRGYVDGDRATVRFNFGTPTGIAIDSKGNLFVCDMNVIRKVAPDGSVSTFAGANDRFENVDGVGAEARFISPTALAIDADDNLYVADVSANTIRKITPARVVTTLAGSPGSYGQVDGRGPAARFGYAEAVAVDPDGNVYVGDVGYNSLRKITPAGDVTTVVTNSGELSGPLGLALDRQGNVYAACYAGVAKVTPHGAVTRLAGNGQLGSTDGLGSAATLGRLTGITYSADGSLYVSDGGFANMVRRVTVSGEVTTIAGLPDVIARTGVGSNVSFYGTNGLAVDASGNLYVSDSGYSNLARAIYGSIRKVAPGGIVTLLAGTTDRFHGSVDGRGDKAQFNYPTGVAVDQSGAVYVSDTENHTVRVIQPDGMVSTLAGAPLVAGAVDGLAADSRFNRPGGIAVNSAGDVFVADQGNHTIRRISGGVVTTYAGMAGQAGADDGPRLTARFTSPLGLAIDAGGALYIADTGNQTIRKIAPDGQVTTLAGIAGLSGAADGVGPAARFNRPVAVAVDGKGNVFVGDSGNQLLRKVTADRSVVTLAGAVATNSYGPKDSSGSAARFGTLVGLAVDGAGNVYVADGVTVRVANTDPGITSQPVSATIADGGSATLSVQASHATGYQWSVDGWPIAGATGATYAATGPGVYRVEVRNGLAATTSAPATVAVTTTLANLSTRGFVRAATGAVIVGFALDAPPGVSKPMLLRAVGPGLGGYGVAAPLAKPSLTLFDAKGKPIARNTSWDLTTATLDSNYGVSPALPGQMRTVGAFALPAGSGDAAFVADLPAGAYTLVCNGTSGTSGVVLGEVYPLSTSEAGRLTNLSTRAYVDAGQGIVIGGFAVVGSQPSRFLVRGVGPGLRDFEVPDALSATVLTVYDQAGQVIATNSGWETPVQGSGRAGIAVSNATVAAMTAAGAFPLGAGTFDSAVIVTLPPGNYSVGLSGRSGATGSVLLEIYRLK